jgi:hypothetical protein
MRPPKTDHTPFFAVAVRGPGEPGRTLRTRRAARMFERHRGLHASRDPLLSTTLVARAYADLASPLCDEVALA